MSSDLVKNMSTINQFLIKMVDRNNALKNDMEEQSSSLEKKINEQLDSILKFEEEHCEELNNIVPDFLYNSSDGRFGFLGTVTNYLVTQKEYNSIKFIREYAENGYSSKEYTEAQLYSLSTNKEIPETGPISYDDISRETFINKKDVSIAIQSLINDGFWQKKKIHASSQFTYLKINKNFDI